MSAWVACGITGRICQKSPPKIKIFPPNGLSICVISRNVQSTASNANLCIIGASSQIKTFATLIKQASLLFVKYCMLKFHLI